MWQQSSRTQPLQQHLQSFFIHKNGIEVNHTRHRRESDEKASNAHEGREAPICAIQKMQYREGCEQALEGLVPSCARSEAPPHTESLAFPASIHQQFGSQQRLSNSSLWRSEEMQRSSSSRTNALMSLPFLPRSLVTTTLIPAIPPLSSSTAAAASPSSAHEAVFVVVVVVELLLAAAHTTVCLLLVLVRPFLREIETEEDELSLLSVASRTPA